MTPTTDSCYFCIRRRGFTLVELLIVLFLMGIVYGLVFNAALPTGENLSTQRLSLRNVDTIFKTSPLYRKEDLWLMQDSEGTLRLIAHGKILSTFALSELGFAYRLNPDETLQSLDYGHLRIDGEEFVPIFILHCRQEGFLDPAILMVKERWLYVHPYLAPKFFDNPVQMTTVIRQSDYLPDKAGYAR